MAAAEIALLMSTIGGTGVVAAVGLPAARVLSRLIMGVGDIGVAFTERPASLVRARTAEMVEQRKAGTLLAVPAIEGSRADRASFRAAAQEERKQVNREAIAGIVFDDLAADPPQTDKPVEEDFMNAFERAAEDASSEELQALFAKLLAGECRNPGTYSKAALNFMNILDKSLAEEIESWSALVAGAGTAYHLPGGGSFAKGKKLLSAGRLESLGLITRGIFVDFGNEPSWVFHERLIFAKRATSQRMPVAYLTPLGREVFGLVPRPLSEEQISELKAFLSGLGYGDFQTSLMNRETGRYGPERSPL